jgi:uncharacterized protein
MFFKPAIDSLKEQGHELLCTSRQYREAVELARIKHLSLKIIGRHGGAERYEKLRESASRIFKLAYEVKKFEPSVAISFSSPECGRVAFGLGIKQIGFNDSPHATAVTKLTIPLLNRLFCPWVIPLSAWEGSGISRGLITMYRALDPVVWLKRDWHTASANLSNDLALETDRKNILIRLEELKASYIADNKLNSSLSMVDNLVNNLSQSTNIIILCRYQDQVSDVEKRYRGKARVIKNVVDGISLISSVDLFIGAGGTMTTEAALLGKPTISISPFRFYVEKYLVRSGLAKRSSNAHDLLILVRKMLQSDAYAIRQKKIAKRILDNMEDPLIKLLSFIRECA